MLDPTHRRPQPGLLERKKLRAMLDIQDVALGLFESEGYRSVSVEQVAAAAGVSASTIYRYFGTKEQLVVWDHIDTLALELLSSDKQVSTPEAFLTTVTAAAPIVIAAVLSSGDERRIKRRVRLMTSEPEIRTGELLQIQHLEHLIRRLLVARLGRDDHDLVVRYVAAQAAWGYLTAIDHWAVTGFTTPLAEILQRTTSLVIKAAAAVLRV